MLQVRELYVLQCVLVFDQPHCGCFAGDGMQLDGKTVTIFGGSDGMGKACASQVLLRGGSVVLVSRTQSKLEAAQQELMAARSVDVSRVRIDAVDATDAAAVEAYFTTQAAGSIDHLICTLGPAISGSDDIADKATMELVKQQFGKFNAAWAVAKYGATVVADGGSLMFFSGALSRNICKGSSCLASANAAIECFTKCLAEDLSPRLRVNCISPGLTRTTAVTGWGTPEQEEGMFQGFGKGIPAGRAGLAEDCGHAAAHLILNGFTTGHILDCDGGAAR
jgi:NAD(P)-dependent dehydrogenase (short-subunit alcohol dehydrogenase family)